SGDQDNPLVPLHSRMRAFDRDLIRGGHYGQRPCAPRLTGRITWLHRPAMRREDFPCQLGAVHTWHKADVPRAERDVRFSNRPSGSSTFRLTTTPVAMSLTGSRFSSDSAPRPFHHGDTKSRWNNLSGGLAVNMTAGPSGQTISPHPSSRAGHHST